MAYASGSRTQLYIGKEVSFGEVPAIAGTKLRRITDSLVLNRDTKVSGEIRSDRQISDVSIVGATAAGSIDGELSYREYDPLMEAALQSTFSSYGVNGTSISITASFATSTLTASVATTGASDFSTLKPGQWVKVSVNGGGANDGVIAQISNTVAPTDTVITFEGTPFATQASVPAVTVSSSLLENGSTQPSFTIERGHEDVSKFLTFRGMTVDEMDLEMTIGDTAMIKFSFMGTDQLTADTTAFTGTAVESQTFDTMNCADGISNLQVGGVVENCFMQDLSVKISNGLRGRTGLGVLGNCDIGSGRFNVTGSFSAYFADFAAYNKFANNERTSVSFTVSDSLGNGYIIDIPEVKYSNGEIDAGDSESDCIVNFEFQGLADPIHDKTMRINRVGE